MTRAFTQNLFLYCLLLCFLWPVALRAQCNISGHFGNYDSLWSNDMHVAALNSASDLYTVSLDIVIQKDTLDASGNFTITLPNLPDEERLYRLTLNEHKGEAMISVGRKTNYIFLLLQKNTKLTINCPNFSKSPFLYQVTGSADDKELQQFESFLYTLHQSTMLDKEALMNQYNKTAFNDALRNYSDTCHNPIISLIALTDINDIGADYKEHSSFYKKILSKVKGTLGEDNIYYKEFNDRMAYFGTKYPEPINVWNIIVIVTIVIIGIIALIIYIVKRNSKQVTSNSPTPLELFNTLSRREKEILALLIEDLPNKEIAARLSLEVSTIKSHIGNVFQKLHITDRAGTKAFASFLEKK